jgi:hypothetical protein
MEVAMFGCWGDMLVGSTPMMQQVLSSIKQSTTNLIIAGDNYYADKRNKKRKIINTETIKTILLMLPDIPIDIITGNHEMDVSDLEKVVFDPIISNPTKCEIIKAEMEIIDELNATRTNKIDIRVQRENGLSETNVSIQPPIRMIGDDCYIFIDSSMFEYSNVEEMECYKDMFGMVGSPNDYRQRQLIVLADLLRRTSSLFEDNTRIFFVAHHPLLIFRYKPASDTKPESAPTNINLALINFLRTLILTNNLNTRPLHYLCADFHVYQHQRLNFETFILDVHIVGTGGADPDDFFDLTKHPIELLKAGSTSTQFTVNDGFVSLEIQDPPLIATCLESKKEFGYLKITKDIEFIYIEKRGGRKTRRKKRSNSRSLIFKKRRQTRKV